MSRRIRTIRFDVLVQDAGAAALSDGAWRLWVAIRTIADDWGTFQAEPRYLAGTIWHDTGRARRVSAWLEELRTAGRIALYVSGGVTYGLVAQWEAEQRLDRRSELGRFPKPPEELQHVTSNLAASLPETRVAPGNVAAYARAAARSPGSRKGEDTDLGKDPERDRACAREGPPNPDPVFVLPDAYAYAYARGISNASAHPIARPTSRMDLDALVAAIDAHCRHEDGSPISRTADVCAWVERTAAAFVPAADDFTRRNGFRVGPFRDWLNAKRPARPIPADRPGHRVQKPATGSPPSWDAGDIPDLSKADVAEFGGKT